MEHVVAKINNTKYMKDRIVYRNYFREYIIFYKDIIKYYIKFCNYYGMGGKFLIFITKDNKKHKMFLGPLNLFVCIGGFEETHISLLKKLAPNAKFIRKEPIPKKVKRKLKEVDEFLRKDD